MGKLVGSRTSRLRRVEPHLVDRLRARLDNKNPQHVMAELGISLNTWNKLLDGVPIRESVANRLVARFGDTSR